MGLKLREVRPRVDRKRADPAPPAGARERCPSKGMLTSRRAYSLKLLAFLANNN